MTFSKDEHGDEYISLEQFVLLAARASHYIEVGQHGYYGLLLDKTAVIYTLDWKPFDQGITSQIYVNARPTLREAINTMFVRPQIAEKVLDDWLRLNCIVSNERTEMISCSVTDPHEAIALLKARIARDKNEVDCQQSGDAGASAEK